MKLNYFKITSQKALLAFGLVLSSFAASAQTNVFDNIINVSPDHTYLAAAINQQGLADALRDPNSNLTVFAPTNAAFEDLADELGTDINGILALPNLTDVLLYHVVGTGSVTSSNLSNGQLIQPLFAGNTIKITIDGTEVFANHASVSTADLSANNGVVHVLDDVILSNSTVVDQILSNGLTTLATAAIEKRLLPVLTDPFATFTVFGPTNTAFDNLALALNTNVQGLLGLPNLTDVLTYHVLDATVASSAVTNGAIVSPLSETNTLKLTKTTTGDVFINQAQVSTADLTASNGVLHIVNGVLLPVETVVDKAIDNGFTTLVTAVVQERLVPALSNPLATLTVFAPTNEAFSALATALNTDINGLLALPTLAEVLKYHVLGTEVPASAVTNGAIVSPLSNLNTLKLTKKTNGEVFVNQAKVTTANVEADNGVVHVLNGVVLPVETVVDKAIDNGFTTLTQAVVKAELLPALSNPLGTFTVFAPTNDAFNDLATALNTDLNGILNLPNLADVLLYHVLGTEVSSAQLTAGAVTTLNGETITISLTGGVKVNDANVTLADVNADNGIVHVIDGVLLPSASINENNDLIVTLYPNPVVNELFVKGLAGGNFQIVDITGSVKKAGNFNESINVSDLSNGNYVLKMTNDAVTYNIRFVK
ncbi:MAG: hypothetical protein RL264_2523 [Bacteroidota bacterium]|jgi:transforming growth factor-beta-induced protein